MKNTLLVRPSFLGVALSLAHFAALAAAPTVVQVDPPPGTLGDLREITVTFSEPVTGIEFSDLLFNGMAPLALSGSEAVWTFTVERPPDGQVLVTWDLGQNISDLFTPPNRFDPTAPGATWQYTLVDTNPPAIASLTPAPGVTVRQMAQLEVLFSELVAGVEAADMLVNGSAATGLEVLGGGRYLFTFSSPASGPVRLAWAPGHGITDFAGNPFAGGSWTNTVDLDFGLPQVRINEFVAANITGLKDEDKQPNGWIELFNYGTNTVNLAGWSLSDDAQDPGRWTFPATNLAAGKYLVVFASGKDRRVAGTNLHANFKLNVNGAYLGLFNAESPRVAVTEFAPHFPPQRNDYAYGLDAAGGLKYFKTPTPGAANGASAITGVLAPPHVNVPRGLFDSPFQLMLDAGAPGAAIRYTLDGTEPTETTGWLYGGALWISNTTVFRAAAFAANRLPSLTLTHTYLFLDQVLRQPNNPPGYPVGATAFGGYPADYEMDPEIVTNSVYGPQMIAALKELPVLSLVMAEDDMFGPVNGIYSHPEPAPSQRYLWERPCSAEFILTNGQTGFQVDCGIRIHGNGSRAAVKTPKHPFRLAFRGEYGAGHLDYPLFPDSPVTRFDTLVLRSDFNNSWVHWDGGQRTRGTRIRDAWGRQTFQAMGQLAGHCLFFHLYINGLYWGVYDFGERVDADFAASYLGGDASEYDAIRSKPTSPTDGTMTAYNTMLSIARDRDMRYLTNYTAALQWLDMTNLMDYMLVEFYGGNLDWGLDNNWNAVRRRAPGETFKYSVWDCEQFMVNVSDNRVANTDTPSGLHPNLLKSPEYRLAFADRVHKHFFNGGALATNVAAARWQGLASQIDPAIVAESARWGDFRRDVAQYSSGPYYLYTRNEFWVPEINRIATNYIPQRHGLLLQQLRTAGLYPNIAAPVFSQFGGRVPRGFALSITATNKVYFTTNGADPRVFGTSAVSPQAQLYAAPLVLGGSLWVKARTLVGTNWSALNAALFTVDTLGAPLRITEIMYNPVGGDAYEFIELQNIGVAALDIGNFSLTGVTYTFPPQTILAPGQIIVLGSSDSPGTWNVRYPGVTAFGRFDGHLSNSGEKLSLLDDHRNVVCSIDYANLGGWPQAADGSGCSLEIIDPWGDPSDPVNWRASAAVDGTPGSLTPPPPLGSVALNEVMAENRSAVANGDTHPDWIELRNLTAQPADLAGWSLTDDDNPRKFVFPGGATIPGAGCLVLWCDSPTNTTPGLHTGFALSRYGDMIFLYDAQTNRVDAVSFGPQVPDLSVGRIEGTWQLTLPTPNAPNQAAPLADSTNLVINEWLANSPPGAQDWIELHNRAAYAPVSLRGLYLGTNTAPFQINSLSFVAPGGFAQLFADAKPGPDHLDFKLPAEGATLLLFSEAGLQIDQVVYGPQTEGVSEGRLPDGAAGISDFPGSASPRGSNYVLAYTGPILNEVMAGNASAVTNALGRTSDWVEIYNPAPAAFDLSGMRLSTKLSDPDPWTFPPGASVPANGYLVVWCDNALPPSTNLGPVLNTGHALGRQGGEVALFNRVGQPVDTLQYGLQVSDLSLGRADGAWRLLAQPTPGAPNAAPAALGSPARLRVNEWMARPLAGPAWFELFNRESRPVQLDGLYLSDNPASASLTEFQIPNLTFVAARGFAAFIADGHPSDGAGHVNFNLDEWGEALRLYSPGLGVIDTVYFGAQAPGVSQGRLPDGAGHFADFPQTASPAAPNFLPFDEVVINEVLARAEPPFEPAVELYNPTGSAADLSGWYLSASPADFQQFRIPDGTSLPAGGYLVFYQAQVGSALALDPARAGQLFLSEADSAGNLTGYRAVAGFGPAASGVSFGRYITSAGVDFAPLSRPTFGVETPASLAQFRSGAGAFNAYPAVGPVVITEIMYHPPDLGTNDDVLDEYLELFNLSADPVPLFDPAHPANTWLLDSGVRFQFPPGLTLPAGDFLLLVSFDPVTNAAQAAAFRARYGVPETVPLSGPYDGKLNNGGDVVELYRPDAPQPGDGRVSYLLVDRVAYANGAPWPVSGAGDGNALQRRAAADYGNEPLNWIAAPPTVGRPGPAAPLLKPLLLAQPFDLAVATNGTAFFTVVAAGSRPLAYQWRFNDIILPAEINPELRLSNLRPDQAGAYAVVVANAAGAVTSAPARLVLTSLPRILVQPKSQVVFSGNLATLTVGVDSPVQYQWRLNGLDLPGATNADLVFTNVQVADSGLYSVQIANPAGSLVSTAATLTVLRALEITAQPQGRSVQPSNSATFTVAAAGTGTLHYQWRYRGFLMGAPGDLPGATNSSLTLASPQLDDAGEYSVLVADDLSSLLSQPATLLVMVRPTIVQQPQGLIVAVGSNVSVAITAQGTLPIGFRWRKLGAGSYLSTNSLYSYTCTYSIANVLTNDATGYNVLMTNAAATSGISSSNAYLAVVIPPTNQLAARGDIVTFSAQAFGRGRITYQWLFNDAALSGATNTTLTLPNVQPTNAGTYAVLVSVITNAPIVPATFAATLTLDSDADGLPDAWELAHGLNPNDPSDALLDNDRDGLSNWAEYCAGTDPSDPQSVLTITSILVDRGPSNLVRLSFGAVSNHSYTVQARQAPATGAWERLADLDTLRPTNSVIQVTNALPAATPQRYYRLVTPRLP